MKDNANDERNLRHSSAVLAAKHLMKLNIAPVLALSAFLLRTVAVAAEPDGLTTPPRLHNGETPPIGSMGGGIGTYLTIEGVRLDAGKTGNRTLLVDIVGGAKLANPVPI